MWLRKLIPSSNFKIVNSLPSLGVDSNFKSVKDGVFRAPIVQFREFGSNSEKKGSITRDWFAQIWNEELKKMKDEESKKMKDKKVPVKIRVFDDSNNGSLNPSTPIEGKLQQLLSRANLVIARDIEWANIVFAFEQENRYVIMDPYNPQSPAGYIREKSNVIFRQLLRSRRPFMAHITDSNGNEVFTVRRPFWWINSTIYAEVDGKEIGVVHKRWHLWKRIYDLYLGNKQFAVVENPGFWNWTFTLKDENENVLAQIDRNWRGIGFELFTDAGQYVIRFGDTGLTIGSFTFSQLNSNIEELEVARSLTLSERAVTVALAMSLDNDYFSRRGGWGLPIMLVGE